MVDAESAESGTGEKFSEVVGGRLAKVKSTLRCACAPSSAPRLRGGRLFGHLLPQAGEGLVLRSPSPAKREGALLLRSGRRWRGAPDEGASGASCFCRGRDRKSTRLNSSH